MFKDRITKLHCDLTFPSITYCTVQHGIMISLGDKRRSVLSAPLEEMPQNQLPAVASTHCKVI